MRIEYTKGKGLQRRFAGPERSVLSLHFPDLQRPAIIPTMESIKYIYWQDQDHWLGYFQDYPDYWTQGESLKICNPTFAICISISRAEKSQESGSSLS